MVMPALKRSLTGLALVLLMGAPGARADTQVIASHVTPQASSAAETSHVVSGAGVGASLHGAAITTGVVAGYFMILSAAADPGNGAVTPVKCVQAPANATVGISADSDTTWDFPKGVVLVFSTTGCFTETQSSTAFFSWQ
jgi:hypothetical protein